MQPLLDSDPRKVGDWTVLNRLSTSGGMSIVYLAERHQTLAAVKVILAEHVLDEDYRRRFRVESESLQRVTSPFVIRLLDTDADAPKPWIAMEYSDAKDLSVTVKRTGPLSRSHGLTFLERLARGVSDLHAADIIHRDIKPANILAADSGPLIIDLGIARVPEGAGTTRYSPATATWASPEQLIDNPDITPASDVFNLGLVGMYTLTGKHPFGPCGNRQEEASTITRMAKGEPIELPLEPDLRALLARCFVDSKARPSALELADLLAEARHEDRIRSSSEKGSQERDSEDRGERGASYPSAEPQRSRRTTPDAKPAGLRIPEDHEGMFILVPFDLASDLAIVIESLQGLVAEWGFEVEEDEHFVEWSGAGRRFAIARSDDAVHARARASSVWEQLHAQQLAVRGRSVEGSSIDVGGRLFFHEHAGRTFAALNSAIDPECAHLIALESFNDKVPTSVTKARRRFPNHGRTWTREQERTLKDLLLQGAPLRRMVERSGRSPSALCSRLQTGGLLGTASQPEAVENAFTITFGDG